MAIAEIALRLQLLFRVDERNLFMSDLCRTLYFCELMLVLDLPKAFDAAYASTFLGSAVFRKTTIYGTFLAALFLATLLNGFTLMAVPYYYSDFIIGIVLILALTLSTDIVFRKRKVSRSSRLPEASE